MSAGALVYALLVAKHGPPTSQQRRERTLPDGRSIVEIDARWQLPDGTDASVHLEEPIGRPTP